MLVFVIAVSTALVVSFMCSIFESVLLSINRAKVEALAADGNRAGLLLRQFKRHIDVPIAAILIVNTIAHTIGSAVAGATYANVFNPDTLWIFTIVFTMAVLLFTEIIPKTLGVTHAEGLATPVALGIHALTIILKPLVLISESISKAIRGGSEIPVTSLEEIRLLTALGRNEGVVGAHAADIIVGATELRNIRVSDVMVHRQSIVWLSGRMTKAEVIEIFRRSGHSRFPFSTTEDSDELSGIVLAKELLLEIGELPDESELKWESLVRDVLVVPESLTANAMLRRFQSSRSHMAIVVDEYGGVSGLITMEDILEEIVGEIFDESDSTVVDISRNDDGSVDILASLELRKLCAEFDSGDCSTEDVTSVGGLVVTKLARIPQRGEHIDWQGLRIKVLEASAKRIERLRVSRTPDDQSPDEQQAVH